MTCPIGDKSCIPNWGKVIFWSVVKVWVSVMIMKIVVMVMVMVRQVSRKLMLVYVVYVCV